jgi:hydroxymethylpyrimidine pyrophosphatase-like HAD family hydrolase
MIVMDGAMMISPDGQIISSYALDKDQTQEIIEIGKKHHSEPLIVGVDDKNIERFRYTNNINELQQQLIADYKSDKRIQFQNNLTPLKDNIKTFFIGKKEPMLELKDELYQIFKDSIEIKFAKDPYIDGYFLTLLHPKGDKAHALEELTAMGDYGELKITAFGDSHNDIGMFEKATTKVCVANAIEELKEIATDILPHTNDEDAVANFLVKRYL